MRKFLAEMVILVASMVVTVACAAGVVAIWAALWLVTPWLLGLFIVIVGGCWAVAWAVNELEEGHE